MRPAPVSLSDSKMRLEWYQNRGGARICGPCVVRAGVVNAHAAPPASENVAIRAL